MGIAARGCLGKGGAFESILLLGLEFGCDMWMISASEGVVMEALGRGCRPTIVALVPTVHSIP
jgi:hypothetical protein